MNTAVQAETTDRIINMGRISRQEDSAFLKARCHTLVHAINIAVENLVPSRLGKESLKSGLCRRLAHNLFVALAWKRGENRTPGCNSVATRYLEKVCPLLRVRKICSKCHTMRLCEVKWRRQHKKAFGERVSFEIYAQRLAHC